MPLAKGKVLTLNLFSLENTSINWKQGKRSHFYSQLQAVLCVFSETLPRTAIIKRNIIHSGGYGTELPAPQSWLFPFWSGTKVSSNVSDFSSLVLPELLTAAHSVPDFWKASSSKLGVKLPYWIKFPWWFQSYQTKIISNIHKITSITYKDKT